MPSSSSSPYSSHSAVKKKSNNYNDNKKIRAHIFIVGKVQGVYFRQNMRIVSARHRVTGWVRNLKDGRVEAVLEGDDIDVSEVIEWCHAGPPKAKVEDVDIKYEKYTGEFREFKVDY
ncbi:MAG TPA: acylphosphatase [Nitrososphaeraceae archaeon]|nr:acylphosphatase [Nitrososphaeraceae archaeon]